MSTVGKVEKGYSGGLLLVKELGNYIGSLNFFQTADDDIYDTISITLHICGN